MLKELINKLFHWLFHKSSDPLKPYNPSTNPLTVEKVSKELNIELEAKRLGESNIPSTDNSSLTGLEARVIQVVQKARQDYVNWAKDRLNVLNRDINRLDMEITSNINRINTAKSDFDKKASKIIADTNLLIKQLASNAKKMQTEIFHFKDVNKLQKDPHYPTPNGRVLRVALLIVLIIMEGAANAVFFQKGIWGGFIQGFIYAAIFAFINVAIAFCLGYFFVPYINHVTAVKKAIGVFSIFMTLITAIAISLMIAHYRDALGMDSDNAAKMALQNMRDAPFGLKEIHSWLLFILSLMFATGAACDAYSMDDPYPGYGKLDKRYKQTMSEYEIEIDHIRNELESLKKTSLDGLDKALNETQSNLMQFYEAMQNKTSTKTTLNNAVSDADHCKKALLHLFRDTNCIYRTTPAPQYFNEDCKLLSLPLPDFGVAGDMQKYEMLKATLESLSPQLAKINEDIQVAFTHQYEQIPTVDIFHTDTVGVINA